MHSAARRRHDPRPASGETVPRMRRVRFVGVAALLTGAFVAPHAAADWPPPETATAADMAAGTYNPDDPGYWYSADGDGQWNFYSFVPTPSGDVQPRPEETASGMSIDLAWRWTIGDPRVLIVVTDSGIKWDEGDLVEKAWINYRELASHKPLHGDGSACAALDPCKQPGIDDCKNPSTEVLAQLDGFDCNDDGILTPSDYKDTPSLSPDEIPATADVAAYPKGDRNHNHVLDAGDLILQPGFSDGIDDDGNGFVDDISGWDFMKGDNDAYDDTRYGHGTGEANDSTRQTNNGAGDAGVCPLCRFIPARVGDSFIADVVGFAHAVTYAADNHASVVQCALGTINMTRFAQAALDYAYSKDVLVVTSMADENSRHHNVPATANHTLPVHAIQYLGDSITQSSSFLDYHPCSNFGGQNLLSASGTGCSSEATGMLSGMSGLLASASIEYLRDKNLPGLSAGEAQQLWLTTADDIDVPESQQPESVYKWSQPGFDQRFGYGRVNANSAIEALKNGKIPPAVDVVSPRWFEVLYRDQATGPVEIHGTVSAKRATSYDVVAEWGAGVQPTEGDYTKFAEQTNVPSDTVLGADGSPLATLDIRTLAFTPNRDIDSPNGENDRTITVRIRAVAHYGGTVGDVRGEMRRTYYVHEDPDLAKGFPIYLGDSGEGSPKMADLDGDGVRELIYPTSGGDLHAFKLTPDGPKELAGFPFRSNLVDGLASPPPLPSVPDYTKAPGYASGDVDTDLGREGLSIAPAVADLDGDGKPDIVFSTFPGTVYAIDATGKLLPGWPIRLPEVPSCPLDPSVPRVDPCMDEKTTAIARGSFAAPVLEDLDGDGKLDVIQAAFDGKIYVWNAGGELVDGWPVEIHYAGKLADTPPKNRVMTTPAVADFNGDGTPDLLVGSNELIGDGGQSGAIYLVDGKGTKASGGPVLPGWPITMTSLYIFPLVAEGVPNAGVVGTFGGTLAAVQHGNGSAPLILPVDPGAQSTIGETPANAIPQRPDPDDPTVTIRGVDPSSIFGELTKLTENNTMLPLFAQPSLGDIDQDGVLDVVASGGSLSLALALQGSKAASAQGDNLLSIWSGKTGAMMPGSPMILEDYTFFNSQAIVDLTGDGYPEVITGSGGYFLHAFDGCGREAEGWPKFTGQWIIPTPAVGDLDGDKTLEVAVGTRSGWLYVWHTDTPDDATIEWESYHHDNRNTGNADLALEQGGKKKAPQPLTVDLCRTAAAVAPTRLVASGGCNCTVAAADDESGATGRTALGLAAALGAALAARRRRRRATP